MHVVGEYSLRKHKEKEENTSNQSLTNFHTMIHFDGSGKEAFRKHCAKMRNRLYNYFHNLHPSLQAKDTKVVQQSGVSILCLRR